MNSRFTAWLSERERAMLDERAQEERTSVNNVVREAVRVYLGIDPLPSRLLHVTTDTPNREAISR